MDTALFLLDAAFDSLMLMLAIRLGGGRIHPMRILLGAIAGAAIAALARTLVLSRMQIACAWLPAAMVMMFIARGKEALRAPMKNTLLLLSAAGLAGGLVLAFYGASDSLYAAYALGALAAVVVGANAVRARRAAQDVQRASVTCTCHGRRVSFDAMIDSGNTLRDYLTHLPVIVIAEKKAKSALRLEGIPMRPIFAQTAGGRLRMDVLVPQEIELEADGKCMNVRAALAISQQLDADAPAIVPAALLDENTDGIISRGG